VGSPVITTTPNGEVNWTEQYVEATGFCVIDRQKFPNDRQAHMMAARGAEIVAKAMLLETVQGLKITRETTVRNLMDVDDVIKAQLEGTIKGVEITSTREVDGGIETVVRMPLYAQNGIAPAAHEALMRRGGSTTGNAATAGKPGMTPAGAATTAGDLQQAVFNFGGGKFDPSLFPVLVDPKGNVVLDYSKYYDPKTGQFPKYLQVSKELLKNTKWQQGVTVIDALQKAGGVIQVNPDQNPKTKLWFSIVKSVGTILPYIASVF